MPDQRTYSASAQDIPLEHLSLRDIGERAAVALILESLQSSPMLVDGLGHDSAFIDLPMPPGHLLVVNTDRSGLNVAYQLGLAGPECVGDLGVSHAVSDVLAAGGIPKALTVALLMPPETSVRFALDVMRGAERAATRYGAVIAGGDTKQNPKFAMVVTAFGTVDREHRLTRSRATPGNLLVVTGHLGSMLLGTIVFRNKIACSTACRAALERALIEQRPPHELVRKLVDARLANACIDISDGLSAALFSMCAASGVGAVIDECRIPVHPDLQDLVRSLGLRPMQIALAGGDWQYLYALSPDELPAAQRLADSLGTRLTVLGQVVASNTVAVRTTEGPFRHLLRIGHDSFGDGRHGIGYFERLQQPQVCFGDEISLETLGYELQVPVSK